MLGRQLRQGLRALPISSTTNLYQMFSTAKSRYPQEAPLYWSWAGKNQGLATYAKNSPEFPAVWAHTPDLPDSSFPFGFHFQIFEFMLFQLAILACVYLIEYLQQIRVIFQFIFSNVVITIYISLGKCWK